MTNRTVIFVVGGPDGGGTISVVGGCVSVINSSLEVELQGAPQQGRYDLITVECMNGQFLQEVPVRNLSLSLLSL